MMRRHVALIVALVAALMLAITTGASARSRYCSPSGDWCMFTYVNKAKKRVFELRTLGIGNKDIQICVTRTSEVCRYRTLTRDSSGVYSNRVRWSSYPYQGHGTYHVNWYIDWNDDGDYAWLPKTLTF